MAEERKGSFIFRPRFLLFCIYVMCYLVIRANGEIVHQVAEMRGASAVTREYIVGSDPSVPRWRRQLYRVVFSPLMVAEEESRRFAANAKGYVRDIGELGQGLLSD